jgi:hypothetical protein
VCHRQVAEPGTVGAEVDKDVAVGKDGDQAGSWVVGEERWQWGQVGTNGVVDRQMVVLPGWKELWRPGNDAGPQPRIAEEAARDVAR